MKRTIFFICSTLLVLASCSTDDDTAYRELKFGMSPEEVQALGYFADEEFTISEEGLSTYRCAYSDFADCNYEKAELCFQDNKLAKVHFYNSTLDAVQQRDISKKVTDFLTSKYGPAKSANKCDCWKDSKRTYILYIHVDLVGDMMSKYINELAVCSNDYYKPKK